MTEATLARIEIDGMPIAFRDEGEGDAVLLLHGWPTSSYLWRNVIPTIAAGNRVIAPDLPGFGESAKPLDRRYDFELFEGVVDGLLGELGVDRVGIAVHDLGGPIGIHWALANRERVSRLALLNTLLYPDFEPAVVEFVTTLANPETRDRLTSPEGLGEVLKLGYADEANASAEVLAAFRAPYADEESRIALANAGVQLELELFQEIASGLQTIEVPVRAVYGAADRVLPGVADTMERVAADIPHAEVTALRGCGHWLMEEEPERVGELLAEFFARTD